MEGGWGMSTETETETETEMEMETAMAMERLRIPSKLFYGASTTAPKKRKRPSHQNKEEKEEKEKEKEAEAEAEAVAVVEQSWERLPRELQESVLSRLSLPDVFCLRCVSSSWRSLLSAPSLLRCPTPPARESWVVMARYRDVFLQNMVLLDLASGRSLRPPFQFQSLGIACFLHRAGSARGLLACQTVLKSVLVLNPLTGYYARLHPPCQELAALALVSNPVGAGDDENGDYGDGAYQVYFLDRQSQLFLYCSRSGSWKALSAPPFPVRIRSLRSDPTRLCCLPLNQNGILLYQIKYDKWSLVPTPFPFFTDPVPIPISIPGPSSAPPASSESLLLESPTVLFSDGKLILVAALIGIPDRDWRVSSEGLAVWQLLPTVSGTEQEWIPISRTCYRFWEGKRRHIGRFFNFVSAGHLICMSGMIKNKKTFVFNYLPLVIYDMLSSKWTWPDFEGYQCVSAFHPSLTFNP